MSLKSALIAAAAGALLVSGAGFAQVPADELQGATYIVDRPVEIATVVRRFRAS